MTEARNRPVRPRRGSDPRPGADGHAAKGAVDVPRTGTHARAATAVRAAPATDIAPPVTPNLVRTQEVATAREAGARAIETLLFRGLSTPLALALVVLQSRFLHPDGRGAFVLAVLTVTIFSRLLGQLGVAVTNRRQETPDLRGPHRLGGRERADRARRARRHAAALAPAGRAAARRPADDRDRAARDPDGRRAGREPLQLPHRALRARPLPRAHRSRRVLARDA